MRHTRNRKTGLRTISIKVPQETSARLVRLARERKSTVSAVVRDAIERYDAPLKGSFADVAGDLIGCISWGPGDLATNPKHLRGYGK